MLLFLLYIVYTFFNYIVSVCCFMNKHVLLEFKVFLLRNNEIFLMFVTVHNDDFYLMNEKD